MDNFSNRLEILIKGNKTKKIKRLYALCNLFFCQKFGKIREAQKQPAHITTDS